MLSAPSQLLLRNIELFEQGRWLLINPADTQIFAELSGYDVSGFHQYFDTFQASESSPLQQVFGTTIELPEVGKYDGVIIYLPKSKAHLSMLLDNVRDVVTDDGTIAVVGTNDGGIKSIGKLLTEQFNTTQKHDSARHCALWCSPNRRNEKPFNIDSYLSVSTYSLDDVKWQIASLPGVFSQSGLDSGTQLLLESLPTTFTKRVLDFACGAGVIGCFLGTRQPDILVSFSDINALALYACQRSCELNGINATIKASNGLNEWQAKRFQSIVSNPPFHSGVSTDYDVTESFIQQASYYLAKGGDLYIVANRFLPYPRLLDECLNRRADLARSNKFSVYHASKR